MRKARFTEEQMVAIILNCWPLPAAASKAVAPSGPIPEIVLRPQSHGRLVVLGEEVGSMQTLGCHVSHATCNSRVVDGIGELKQALGFSPEKARVEHDTPPLLVTMSNTVRQVFEFRPSGI
jgi:hypothetical protein